MSASALAPLHVFRFHVRFRRDGFGSGNKDEVPLCDGAFAECSGLEATMEPKLIKSGGLNYGAAQRMGPVSFATVILRRGVTSSRDLWQWFQLVNGYAYAYRLAVEIDLHDIAGAPVMTWKLARAMPVKFKAADFNARASEVGVEELHLVHEGLHLVGAG